MKQQLIDKVKEFRDAFNLSQPEEAIHYKLTLEETDELFDAILVKDRKEIIDALADRVFTSAGGILDGHDLDNYLDKTIEWASRLGVDLPRAVQAVFESNMSKLCYQGSNSALTADKYHELGVETHFEPVDEMDVSAGFRCICSETVIGTDSKEYPKSKLLKSVSYKEPDFSYLD